MKGSSLVLRWNGVRRLEIFASYQLRSAGGGHGGRVSFVPDGYEWKITVDSGYR